MESTSGKDPDVKAWAAKTLPTVEEHLKMAQQISKTLGSTTITRNTSKTRNSKK
jgi:putative membrane protein